jgi:hypothetical protein
MTSIVITALKTIGSVPFGAKPFSNTKAEVTDNAGNVLPAVLLSGSEATPWSASLTGTAGSQEASVTFTDLDVDGNPIGAPVTITETGSGGQDQPFPKTTGGTITVS